MCDGSHSLNAQSRPKRSQHDRGLAQSRNCAYNSSMCVRPAHIADLLDISASLRRQQWCDSCSPLRVTLVSLELGERTECATV